MEPPRWGRRARRDFSRRGAARARRGVPAQRRCRAMARRAVHRNGRHLPRRRRRCPVPLPDRAVLRRGCGAGERASGRGGRRDGRAVVEPRRGCRRRGERRGGGQRGGDAAAGRGDAGGMPVPVPMTRVPCHRTVSFVWYGCSMTMFMTTAYRGRPDRKKANEARRPRRGSRSMRSSIRIQVGLLALVWAVGSGRFFCGISLYLSLSNSRSPRISCGSPGCDISPPALPMYSQAINCMDYDL
mmetsp:Transcript_26382/g.88984  ORF Transcript_26382/g.88984 Transcript_26382/m.88984 type:complete len:242 (+) Transcript_26382:253-978(+)